MSETWEWATRVDGSVNVIKRGSEERARNFVASGDETLHLYRRTPGGEWQEVPTGDAAPSAPAWTKPYPFDPASDYPPDAATVTLINTRFVFDETGPYWRAPDGSVARPFTPAGIDLARIWARESGTPTAEEDTP